jgi:hypothetical protein
MREADVRQALATSMDSVLEQMFFVTELAETDPAADPPPEQLRARVRFEGDPSGWIDVEVESAAATAMAADFLAEDAADLSSGQVEDVVLELSNMLCGAALSRLEPGALIRLFAPQILAPDPASHPAVAARSVSVGTGVVTASVHFESPCPT